MSTEQPKKRRRVRERLPVVHPEGDAYGAKYYAGQRLFDEEFATEAHIRATYPTHFELEPRFSQDALCHNIRRLLWRSLSPEQIREWNNNVEADHEAKKDARDREVFRCRQAVLRHNEIIKKTLNRMPSSILMSVDWNSSTVPTREQIIKYFVDRYDEAAHEVDSAAGAREQAAGPR